MDISFPLIIENKHVSTSLVKLKFLLLWQYIHYINFKIHLKYLIIKMIHYSFNFIFSLLFLITTPPGVGVGLGEGRTYSVYFPFPGSSPVGKKKKKSPVVETAPRPRVLEVSFHCCSGGDRLGEMASDLPLFIFSICQRKVTLIAYFQYNTIEKNQ